MTTTVADLALTLQTLFTTEADDAAQASGFVRRRRKLSGAGFVQALTFGWLANPNASLDELADLADDLGCPVSAQALDQRFTPQAVDCLSRVLNAALLRLVEACPVAAPLLQRFRGVYARDCSSITLPATLAEVLPGCGHGKPEIPCAGVKLHVGVELGTGALENLSLQPARTSDRCCVGTHAPLPEGALLLEDLGFHDMRRLRHYDEQGGYVLSRAPTRLLVRAAGQRPKDLAKFLQGVPGDRVDCWVTLGRRQRTWRCRLIAVRVPEEVARQRLERAQKEARESCRKLSEQKRALCAWTVLLTNAPAQLLSVEEALALRRLRWQIELLFRLWKDEGKIDESRGTKPDRVLCELLAKLLGQVVQHWATLLAGGPLEISGVKAARRVRRRAARLAESLGCLTVLVGVLGRLQERLRRRACVKRGRPGRPTTLELVCQAAPGDDGATKPTRLRSRIPRDIAKKLRVA
jgi:Transposase DDE domain